MSIFSKALKRIIPATWTTFSAQSDDDLPLRPVRRTLRTQHRKRRAPTNVDWKSDFAGRTWPMGNVAGKCDRWWSPANRFSSRLPVNFQRRSMDH